MRILVSQKRRIYEFWESFKGFWESQKTSWDGVNYPSQKPFRENTKITLYYLV